MTETKENYNMKHLDRNYNKYQPKHLAETSRDDTYNDMIFIPVAYVVFALAVLYMSICAVSCDKPAYTEDVTIVQTTQPVQPVQTTETIPSTESNILDLTYTLSSSKDIYKFLNSSTTIDDYSTYNVDVIDNEPVTAEEEIFCDCEEPTSNYDNQLDAFIGSSVIELGTSTLIKYDLPDKYYPGIDYSSFQPYMPYTAITAKSSQAYWVVHSENCYTDEYGLRRYKTNDSQFTINGQDDYVIALGNFYKEKGSAGGRYLIVTTTGMYTAIIGDEKADQHTDPMNMYSYHGNKAGLIEWLVDKSSLNSTIKRMGTVTVGGPEVARGDILYIYQIT